MPNRRPPNATARQCHTSVDEKTPIWLFPGLWPSIFGNTTALLIEPGLAQSATSLYSPPQNDSGTQKQCNEQGKMRLNPTRELLLQVAEHVDFGLDTPLPLGCWPRSPLGPPLSSEPLQW